jgi:hypothetical protein
MLAASFISALLLASTAPALRVEISSPKTRVSVFEPVKLTVRATAMRAVEVPGVVDTTGNPLLETWIDYGQGYVRYVDYDGDMREGVEGARRSLKVGDRFVETLVLVNGPMDRPTVPFPSSGRYPLHVVVRSPEQVVLGESNMITFDVVPAEGEDAALVQRVRNEPWVLRGGLPNAGYAALAAQYPTSPYLHWGKRAIALEKSHRIHNARYPDTNEKFADISRAHPLTPQLYRQLADELRSASWGQFDEERLRLAAEDLERVGDFVEAKNVWREIVEHFPASEAAEEAKSRIDSTPPVLQLAASPAMLWPPNNELVTVTVTVEVSDDTDPRHSVKLLSITCDDACKPPQDVVGAALNTDDRSFQLRATRRGGGNGRTYTITYSGTDSAGNQTVKTVTIRVPHDQGK